MRIKMVKGFLLVGVPCLALAAILFFPRQLPTILQRRKLYSAVSGSTEARVSRLTKREIHKPESRRLIEQSAVTAEGGLLTDSEFAMARQAILTELSDALYSHWSISIRSHACDAGPDIAIEFLKGPEVAATFLIEEDHGISYIASKGMYHSFYRDVALTPFLTLSHRALGDSVEGEASNSAIKKRGLTSGTAGRGKLRTAASRGR